MYPAVAYADVSSDSVVKATPGAVVAVVLSAAAGAAATLVLHDNASAASGDVLCSLTALAGDSVSFCPCLPWATSLGIYANIGGAGANATVLYK